MQAPHAGGFQQRTLADLILQKIQDKERAQGQASTSGYVEQLPIPHFDMGAISIQRRSKPNAKRMQLFLCKDGSTSYVRARQVTMRFIRLPGCFVLSITLLTAQWYSANTPLPIWHVVLLCPLLLQVFLCWKVIKAPRSGLESNVPASKSAHHHIGMTDTGSCMVQTYWVVLTLSGFTSICAAYA